VAHVIPPFSSLALGMKMSEKYKYAQSSAIQVKKQGKAVNIDKKLDVIS
jgi:hypothetical protein